jgi:hypothetical protein
MSMPGFTAEVALGRTTEIYRLLGAPVLTAGDNVTPQFNCDFGCLLSCAPGCSSCGTNVLCWLGCAGLCALRCCHF